MRRDFNMNRILLIFTLFFVVSFLHGEVRTITLSNAIEIALLNNLQIKQMEQELKIAQAQYDQSFADFALPDVSASASAVFNDPSLVDRNKIISPNLSNMYVPYPSVDPGTGSTNGWVTVPTYVPVGVSTNQTVWFDNYSLSFNVTKPIFAGFRLWNGMEIRRVNLDLSKQKLEDKKREIEQTISTAFYRLFLLKESAKLAQETDRSLKERLNYTSANYKAGLVPQYDLLRAEVQLKNNQPNLIRTSNEYEAAKIDFLNQLRLTNTEVEFIGNFFDATNVVLSNTEREYIVKRALSNDINLKSMDINIEVLKLTKAINSGLRYPTVSAFFNYKFDYALYNRGDVNRTIVPSWNVGLQATMAIDDWLPSSKTSKMIEESEENIKKAEYARSQMVDSITLQIDRLLMQLEEAKQNIASQSEAVRLAKLGYDLANERYRYGTSSSLEVSDALLSLNQAELNYLQAVFSYYSSTLQLKKMIGE